MVVFKGAVWDPGSRNWVPWASSSKLDRKDAAGQLDHDSWLACRNGRRTWLSNTWAAWASGWATWAERVDSAWARAAMLTNRMVDSPEKILCPTSRVFTFTITATTQRILGAEHTFSIYSHARKYPTVKYFLHQTPPKRWLFRKFLNTFTIRQRYLRI